MVEDFNPQIIYHPGKKNIEANTLSCHAMDLDARTMAEELFINAFLNYPRSINQFPVQYTMIHQAQQLRAVEVDPLTHDEYDYS